MHDDAACHAGPLFHHVSWIDGCTKSLHPHRTDCSVDIDHLLFNQTRGETGREGRGEGGARGACRGVNGGRRWWVETNLRRGGSSCNSTQAANGLNQC